jgi:hypothetical protein
MHSFSSDMHMKLFPDAQYRSSFAFFAQWLYVGQEGQVHIAAYFFPASARSCSDIPAIDLIVSSNLSIPVHLDSVIIWLFFAYPSPGRSPRGHFRRLTRDPASDPGSLPG